MFAVESWERVARDVNPSYPVDGQVPGIGPIASQLVAVTEKNHQTDELLLVSPGAQFRLAYQEGVLTIASIDAGSG